MTSETSTRTGRAAATLATPSHVGRMLSALAVARPTIVAATALYGLSLHYAHVAYLYPVWEYYGFTYRAPGAAEAAAISALLLIGALLVPAALSRPSSIVVLLLFVVVYVPTTVLTPCLDADTLARYGPSLVFLSLGFALVCIAARARLARSGPPGSMPRVPSRVFERALLVIWCILGALLIARYGSVMTFATLDQTYEQRAAGASTSLLMGYVQTYFSNVFSPALLAIGLVRRRPLPVALGIAGCVIMYMITAQRTVILLPVAIIGLHLLVSRRSVAARSATFLMLAVALPVVVASAYYEDSAVASLLAVFLVFRTLALPGLTFSQYFDLFSAEGFTWWSHIRGVDAFVAPPPVFANDPLWPNLGYIIGDRIYNNAENNANANLFSGDGIAAAGELGVIVIAMVLACWLAVLDRAGSRWSASFTLLVLLPVALSLTNAHLFTTLLSFGGLFWTLLFLLTGRGESAGRSGTGAAAPPAG